MLNIRTITLIQFVLIISTFIESARLSKALQKETDLTLFSVFQPSTKESLGYVLVIAFEIVKKSSSTVTVRPYYLFTSAYNSDSVREARDMFEMVSSKGNLSRNFPKENELDFELTKKQNESTVDFEIAEENRKYQFSLKISKTPIGKSLIEEFIQGIANISLTMTNNKKNKSLRLKNMYSSDLTNFFLRFDQASKNYKLSQIKGMKYPIKFYCDFPRSSIVSLDSKDSIVVNLYVANGNGFLVNLFYDFKQVGEVKQYPVVESQLRTGFLNLPTFVASFKDIIVLINNSLILDYLFILDERKQPKLMVSRYDFNGKKAITATCVEVK